MHTLGTSILQEGCSRSTHWVRPSFRLVLIIEVQEHTSRVFILQKGWYWCRRAHSGTSILQEGCCWCRSTHWAHPSFKRAGDGAGAHIGHVHPAGGLVQEHT